MVCVITGQTIPPGHRPFPPFRQFGRSCWQIYTCVCVKTRSCYQYRELHPPPICTNLPSCPVTLSRDLTWPVSWSVSSSWSWDGSVLNTNVRLMNTAGVNVVIREQLTVKSRLTSGLRVSLVGLWVNPHPTILLAWQRRQGSRFRPPSLMALSSARSRDDQPRSAGHIPASALRLCWPASQLSITRVTSATAIHGMFGH